MPYTDDPENVPADRVRFLVGDTAQSGTNELTDNEVAYLLSTNNDNASLAAARAAEILAAKYASVADEKQVGPLRLRYERRSARYEALARALRTRSAKGAVAPYAGGISLSDKREKALDGDRVRPTFTRRMMQYPNTDARVTSEEVLSPPEVP